jgi:hypothetical protein
VLVRIAQPPTERFDIRTALALEIGSQIEL